MQQWGEEQGKKLQPVVEPIGKHVEAIGKALHTQLVLLAQRLEAPANAFKLWLQETMRCLCLPIQQQLNYKDFKAAEASKEYPPAAYAEAAPLV